MQHIISSATFLATNGQSNNSMAHWNSDVSYMHINTYTDEILILLKKTSFRDSQVMLFKNFANWAKAF